MATANILQLSWHNSSRDNRL